MFNLKTAPPFERKFKKDMIICNVVHVEVHCCRRAVRKWVFIQLTVLICMTRFYGFICTLLGYDWKHYVIIIDTPIIRNLRSLYTCGGSNASAEREGE